MQRLAFFAKCTFFLKFAYSFLLKKQTDEQITIVGDTFCMHAVFVWG